MSIATGIRPPIDGNEVVLEGKIAVVVDIELKSPLAIMNMAEDRNTASICESLQYFNSATVPVY